ncbi:MAG: ribonuclease H-like domain-containing protein [Myxococcales bacterium]
MSLKSKLSRLPSPVARGAPNGSEPDQDATLTELRAKMQEILGREEQPARAPANPSVTTLPFLPVEASSGRLHRRCQRVSKSKSIGRIPVDAALGANPELLGLLALDPTLSACHPGRCLFLDTETTGLGGGAGTIAFLIGLAWFEEGELWLEQLLLTSPVDEAAMLECLDARLSRANMLCTFNGKTFDWPLLMGRYVMNHRAKPAPLPHLDLLHIARRLHKRRLGSVTLKHVESEVLGLERGPDIDGAEIGPRYAHFLRTGDESALTVVVEHNATDVLSMAALVGLYGEPLELLAPLDLVGLGQTLWRAGEHERAVQVVETAQHRGAGSEALRLSALIHKARGDRARALRDFEALAQEIDDPKVRLHLVKLYEHFAKDHQAALTMLDRGTSESIDQANHRRARLERKLAKLR